jgi:hypothetical protein
MILFSLIIRNPFKLKQFNNNQKDLFFFYKGISKNKTFEFQVFYSMMNLLEINFDIIITGRDHAGIELEVGLFGLNFVISTKDNRHWDYENNKWESIE